MRSTRVVIQPMSAKHIVWVEKQNHLHTLINIDTESKHKQIRGFFDVLYLDQAVFLIEHTFASHRWRYNIIINQ